MKISIITATYNSADTVRDTLESILRQTYQDWELIIEDGLSKDDTLSIVREYEPQCKGRMHIYSEKDNGLYDAMNRGIARATGDVIGILNSDDFDYDAQSLEHIANAFLQNDTDCVYGNLVYVDRKDKKTVRRTWIGRQHEQGAFVKGWHPAHPTFYARRTCFEQFGDFNLGYAISADFELMLRFIEKEKIRNTYLDQYLVKMRTGGESTNSVKNIITGNKNVLRAIRDNGFKPSQFYLTRRLIPKFVNMFMQSIKSLRPR